MLEVFHACTRLAYIRLKSDVPLKTSLGLVLLCTSTGIVVWPRQRTVHVFLLGARLCPLNEYLLFLLAYPIVDFRRLTSSMIRRARWFKQMLELFGDVLFESFLVEHFLFLVDF